MIDNKDYKKKNYLKMILNKISIHNYQSILKKVFYSHITLSKTKITKTEKLKNRKFKKLFYKLDNLSLLIKNPFNFIKYFILLPTSRFKFLKNSLKKNKKISTKINNLNLNEINADNFIFYLYLLVGIFISLSTFSLFTMRIISENKSLEKDIENSMQKKSKIPEITTKLKKLRAQSKLILSDNEFILNLIGNDKDISTLLYIVNLIANKNNVDIVELEPQEKITFKVKPNLSNNNINNSSILIPPSNILGPQPIPVGNNQNNLLNDEVNNEIKNNYLLTSKLERQIFNLKFRGFFEDSIKFIKDLEQLENIVIFEDLKLKRLQDYNKSSRSKVLFESKLSVFGSQVSNKSSNN